MAEKQQSKLQEAVNSMMDGLESKHLRPMQKQSFLAMAKCCDNSSRDSAQQCFANASVPVQRAEVPLGQRHAIEPYTPG